MRFTKMQGAGNDYVYVDCFNETLPDSPDVLAGKVADRHFGIGSDGLVLICPSELADAQMRMFNPDGSESEMCGNAIRCVAKYLFDHRICQKEQMTIQTGAGLLTITVEVERGRVVRARVDMGEPVLQADLVPTTLQSCSGEGPVVLVPLLVDGAVFNATCVSMGNPHAVFFVDAITDRHITEYGPKIETHASFPRRTNVEFVEILTRGELRMRVWERGTGETMACGTGACATAVAAVLAGVADRHVTIHLRGGDLEIDWNEQTNHVIMTGPAVEVFSGEIDFE
ncbi:MAG: diaminopimelate epimerase [Planctomycetia bacterium]|nr:diaminopimelate epimerase [Planctomycetia bacterium]